MVFCSLLINRLSELLGISSAWNTAHVEVFLNFRWGQCPGFAAGSWVLFYCESAQEVSSLPLWVECTSLFFSGFVLDNMMSKLGTSDEVPSIWWESWASAMLTSSLVIAFCLSLQWKLTGYTVHFVLESLHALPSPVLNSICYFFVFVSHFSWCKSFSWCFNICSHFAKIQCPNFLGVGNCDAMRMFC